MSYKSSPFFLLTCLKTLKLKLYCVGRKCQLQTQSQDCCTPLVPRRCWRRHHKRFPRHRRGRLPDVLHGHSCLRPAALSLTHNSSASISLRSSVRLLLIVADIQIHRVIPSVCSTILSRYSLVWKRSERRLLIAESLLLTHDVCYALFLLCLLIIFVVEKTIIRHCQRHIQHSDTVAVVVVVVDICSTLYWAHT